MSANGSRVSLTDATNTNIYNNLITNGNLTTTVLNMAGYSNEDRSTRSIVRQQDNLTASTLTIGTLRAGNGTVAAPSISFTVNTNSGMYSEETRRVSACQRTGRECL
jgi:hypothetical protein